MLTEQGNRSASAALTFIILRMGICARVQVSAPNVPAAAVRLGAEQSGSADCLSSTRGTNWGKVVRSG